jgi:serine/threonine protein kinase
LFENLQSEIQILKSLSHRHITRLIDIVVCSLVIRTSVFSIYDGSELKSISISLWNTVPAETLPTTSRSEDVWRGWNTYQRQEQPCNTTRTHEQEGWTR